MPPPLALVLTAGFVTVLLWRDDGKRAGVSAALWLPVAWIFFVGGKFASQWLTLLGGSVQAITQEDGSPIDSVVFLTLIVAGAIVLSRRRVSPITFASNNLWVTVFFAYCFLSIAWSDFPFVALKRWVKILGHPIMALIILTDPVPREALRSALKRSSYLLLPGSVLFIRYYPQYGRSFDNWTGAATNVGMMNTKNDLGYVCMVFGLFYFWNLLSAKQVHVTRRREEIVLSIAFLWMIWWLLSMANSATAVACILIGAATMVAVSTPLVSKKFIGTQIVMVVLLLVSTELVFGFYSSAVGLLGRDASLTDRTAVWRDVVALVDNPWIGAGFESFWLGPRLDKMWAKWWWHPIQAHNGYIETYLNLGWIGLLILAGVLFATFWKSRRELLQNLEFGRFRLGVLFAVIVYNYTEAAFKNIHLVWTLFHLIAIDYAMDAAAASETDLLLAPTARGQHVLPAGGAADLRARHIKT
jgi:exopolysaccharide production protein ExoQ